jgi:hypothetical protein
MNTASTVLSGVAFIPPLLASMFITMKLRIHDSRTQDRVLMVCGFFWLPILSPCFAVAWLIDNLIGGKRF